MGDGHIALVEVVDLEKDFLYTPISFRGRNKRDAISVGRYSEDKKLLNSLKNGVIDLSQEDDDDEVQIINPISSFRKKPSRYPSVTEPGQSSNSSNTQVSTFVCEICVESKYQIESFSIKGFTHSYCSECMAKYVASKIQENITYVKCPVPNCLGVLEPEFCCSILPQEVFDRWDSALCESLILGALKFYCPFKDCSALLINDEGLVITGSECPHCRRMFCAQCNVPWHYGIECREFQKLNKGEREREDIMLMKLAKDKNWQRCPKCKVYVERIDGCLFMKCRCGFCFYYHCAAPITPTNHNCAKCMFKR